MIFKDVLEMNIVERLGFDGAPEEEQKTLLLSLVGAVLERALARVLAKLSAPEQEALVASLQEAPTLEKRFAALAANDHLMEEFLWEEALILKKDLLDRVQEFETI